MGGDNDQIAERVILSLLRYRARPLREIARLSKLGVPTVRRALARLKYHRRVICGRRDGVPSTHWSRTDV